MEPIGRQVHEVVAGEHRGAGRQPWTPFDLLLFAEFCSPAAIPPVAQRLRQELEAEAVMLLVAGSRGLLGTLCFHAGDDVQTDRLVDGFFRNGPARVRRKLRARHDWSAEKVVGRLVRIAAEEHRRDLIEILGAPEDWAPVATPGKMVGMPLKVVAFALKPAAPPQADATMLELAVMASSTANASVYRDTMTTTRVDDKLDLDRRRGPGQDPAEETQLLVELAAEVTSSAAAAYYVWDPVDRSLRLVAAHPEPGAGEVVFPEEIAGDSSCAAAVAVDRRRPMAHGWDGLEPEVEATGIPSIEMTGLVEVATPVPGPPASARASSAGVLTVMRLAGSGGEPDPYAAYDYALLRNVALRLALLRATENMEAASELFRDLVIRGPQTLSVAAIRERGEPYRPRTTKPIPGDLTAVLPSIEAALGKIARLTGSHSATLRLALPDLGTSAAHGLSLFLVAAHSETGLIDSEEVQNLDGGGINWVAASTGRVQNVPFVRRAKGYKRVRERTMAEISVPVTVEGMVVGVVNLESPVARAYDARVSTAIAFAEHVGAMLADARLAKARHLHHYATQIVRRGHDLSAETLEIDKALASSPPGVRTKVDAVMRKLDEKFRGIARFDPTEDRQPGATLPDLAEAARRNASIEDVSVRGDLTGPEWLPLDEESTGLVSDSLRHVFVNVQNHMPIDAKEPPELTFFNGVVWGGRSYDVVRIRNESKRTIDAWRAVNLYRVPIVDRERRLPRSGGSEVDLPRFGAYLAGNQARAVGGNVHLVLEPADRVRLTVMIPQPILEAASG
jgi:hypothetical protein